MVGCFSLCLFFTFALCKWVASMNSENIRLLIEFSFWYLSVFFSRILQFPQRKRIPLMLWPALKEHFLPFVLFLFANCVNRIDVGTHSHSKTYCFRSRKFEYFHLVFLSHQSQNKLQFFTENRRTSDALWEHWYMNTICF